MAISLPRVVSAGCGCVTLNSPHTGAATAVAGNSPQTGGQAPLSQEQFLAQWSGELVPMTRRATSQAIEELEKSQSAMRQELIKADDITGQQLLTSPVDGVVQQLSVTRHSAP